MSAELEKLFPSIEEAPDDYDLQVTLYFSDNTENTWTVIRNQNMRWSGNLKTDVAIVKIECEWFYNPTVLKEGESTNE